MPNRDRTGPTGAGPMTGRGMGYCGRTDRSENMRFGRGFGGLGRGWRNQYLATGLPGWVRGNQALKFESRPSQYAADIPRENELELLKSQSEILENNLSELKKRIIGLEGSIGG